MEWIKCSDRLPTEQGRYLVYMDELGVMTCAWRGIDNPDRPFEHTGWKLPYEFSHWMPLPPEPPKD